MNESKPIAAYRKYIPVKRQAELGVLPEKLTIAEIASLHPDGDAFAKLLLAAHDVFLNHGSAQHYGPDIHPPPDPKFGKGLPGEHIQGWESLDIILSFPKEDPPWEPDPSAGDIRNALLISVYRDDLRAWLQEIGLSLPEDALLRAWWPGEKTSPAISIEDALTRQQLRQIGLRWLFKVLELTTSTADPFEVLTALLGRGLDLTAQVGDQGDEQRVRPEDVSAALAEAEREYRALQDARFDGTAIDEWKREAEIWKRPVAVGEHHMALGELLVAELGYAAACSRLGLSAYHWPKVHWPQALADLDERKCSEAPPYVRMRAWRPGETDPPASADAGHAGAGDPETDAPAIKGHIEKILKALSDKDWPLDDIPRGGKAAIERALTERRTLTRDQFKRAWTEMNKRGLVRVKDKDKYVPRSP